MYTFFHTFACSHLRCICILYRFPSAYESYSWEGQAPCNQCWMPAFATEAPGPWSCSRWRGRSPCAGKPVFIRFYFLCCVLVFCSHFVKYVVSSISSVSSFSCPCFPTGGRVVDASAGRFPQQACSRRGAASVSFDDVFRILLRKELFWMWTREVDKQTEM